MQKTKTLKSQQKYIRIQVGTGNTENDYLEYNSTFRLELDNLDVSTVEKAQETLAKLDAALNAIKEKLSHIGMMQNRLASIYDSLVSKDINL